MNINQLKIKLKELQTNLQNRTVIKVLTNNQFNIESFEKSIEQFYKNIEIFIKDEVLLKSIETKVNQLVEWSNRGSFTNYSHEFINAATFLISNTSIESKEEDSLTEQIEISEEEFLQRYNKLIDLLNLEGEDANLILETKSQGKPFKVFKTKNNTLAFYTESSSKPMTIATDIFIDVAFKRKTTNLVYVEDVLIPRIKDNSIFDFIQHDSTPKDLLEAMKEKLKRNENELLIVKNKLEEIQEENKTVEEKKQQFDEVLEKSESLDNKIKAAEDKAKLGASISYWKEKEKVHRSKFKSFSFVSIGLILVLIGILFYVINSNDNKKHENIKTITNVSTSTNNSEKNKIIIENKETKSELKNITAEKSKLNDFQNFDLSRLGLYALMIFASSSIFWIIRITVKIALSNLHLSEDAYERVVMIQTYLSFVQEGEIEEKDKELILSSLFRPSNIGIIKDESSVTVTDIMTAFKK